MPGVAPAPSWCLALVLIELPGVGRLRPKLVLGVVLVAVVIAAMAVRCSRVDPWSSAILGSCSSFL